MTPGCSALKFRVLALLEALVARDGVDTDGLDDVYRIASWEQ
jgi:hypothetical protein